MPQRKPQKNAKRRPAVRRTVAPPAPTAPPEPAARPTPAPRPAPAARPAPAEPAAPPAPPIKPETAVPPPEETRSRFRFAGDLARAADVARVLAKYGLAQWLSDSDFEPVRNALKSETGESLMAQPFEARVRLALTDLGATYIKLGQMLSTRADLVGQDLANELTKLQAQTPADAPAVARKVVESELGLPIEEIFSEFDETALASASIGQVHRARLKTGKRVVVKVQHPGIEGIIRRDLDILGFLAEMAEMNDTLKRYQPISIVKEFGRTMLNELDFRRE